MAREKPRGALIGAYGLFWDHDWVEFDGFGPDNVPLFGRRTTPARDSLVVNAAAATACYVLYNDYGPIYTGISDAGLGRRLKQHHKNPPRGEWTRFSWFAFGDVGAMNGEKSEGWSTISRRSRPEATNPEANVRELEALLIQLLGLPQNQMKFQRADKWDQVDFYEASDLIADRYVSDSHFPPQWKRRWARGHTHGDSV